MAVDKPPISTSPYCPAGIASGDVGTILLTTDWICFIIGCRTTISLASRNISTQSYRSITSTQLSHLLSVLNSQASSLRNIFQMPSQTPVNFFWQLAKTFNEPHPHGRHPLTLAPYLRYNMFYVRRLGRTAGLSVDSIQTFLVFFFVDLFHNSFFPAMFVLLGWPFMASAALKTNGI